MFARCTTSGLSNDLDFDMFIFIVYYNSLNESSCFYVGLFATNCVGWNEIFIMMKKT
jgi:hypothetical protein